MSIAVAVINADSQTLFIRPRPAFVLHAKPNLLEDVSGLAGPVLGYQTRNIISPRGDGQRRPVVEVMRSAEAS